MFWSCSGREPFTLFGEASFLSEVGDSPFGDEFPLKI